MHDLEGVQETNSNDNLLDDLGGIILFQVLSFFDKLKQVFTIDQLGYDVDVSLSLDALLELKQQGMRNHLHYTALVAWLSDNYAIRFFA